MKFTKCSERFPPKFKTVILLTKEGYDVKGWRCTNYYDSYRRSFSVEDIEAWAEMPEVEE